MPTCLNRPDIPSRAQSHLCRTTWRFRHDASRRKTKCLKEPKDTCYIRKVDINVIQSCLAPARVVWPRIRGIRQQAITKKILRTCVSIYIIQIYIYIYIYICLYIYIYILLPIFCETPLRMNLGPSRCGSSIHDINRMKTIDIIFINKDRMKTIDTISIALLFSLHSIVAKTLQKFAVESESWTANFRENFGVQAQSWTANFRENFEVLAQSWTANFRENFEVLAKSWTANFRENLPL